MQTFLPYPDYQSSAQVLDRGRLGQQRNEVFVILNARLQDQEGWQNVPWLRHPACLMWTGYEYQLALYGLEVCKEWQGRGYKDSVEDKILKLMPKFPVIDPTKPHWLGDPTFHTSHQSNLLRKFPEHYKMLWPNVEPGLEYVWPASRFS